MLTNKQIKWTKKHNFLVCLNIKYQGDPTDVNNMVYRELLLIPQTANCI